jgi:hypothetical protein
VNVIFLSATFGVPSQTGTPTLILRQKIWDMQNQQLIEEQCPAEFIKTTAESAAAPGVSYTRYTQSGVLNRCDLKPNFPGSGERSKNEPLFWVSAMTGLIRSMALF